MCHEGSPLHQKGRGFVADSSEVKNAVTKLIKNLDLQWLVVTVIVAALDLIQSSIPVLPPPSCVIDGCVFQRRRNPGLRAGRTPTKTIGRHMSFCTKGTLEAGSRVHRLPKFAPRAKKTDSKLKSKMSTILPTLKHLPLFEAQVWAAALVSGAWCSKHMTFQCRSQDPIDPEKNRPNQVNHQLGHHGDVVHKRQRPGQWQMVQIGSDKHAAPNQGSP